LIITPARDADVATIMEWRRDLTQWLRGMGEDQWSVALPTSAVAATVSSGQTWMVWDCEDPIATITLSAYEGLDNLWTSAVNAEALWTSQDDPADALYVAKMMVCRTRAGENIGGEMLDWAGGRAFAAGLAWVRLDAWTTNPRLHDYYRSQGFTHVRTVPTRPSGACFQRPSQPYTRGRLKTEV